MALFTSRFNVDLAAAAIAATIVFSSPLLSHACTETQQPAAWMQTLTDASYMLDDPIQGKLEGKNALFYAYGPPFDAKGQIGMWTYDDGSKSIDFYWSKPHCPGKTANGCKNGRGNIPGSLAKGQLTPKFSAMQIDNAFPPPKKFQIKLAKDGKWYATDGKCWVDRVLVCTTKWTGAPATWKIIGFKEPGKKGGKCDFAAAAGFGENADSGGSGDNTLLLLLIVGAGALCWCAAAAFFVRRLYPAEKRDVPAMVGVELAPTSNHEVQVDQHLMAHSPDTTRQYQNQSYPAGSLQGGPPHSLHQPPAGSWQGFSPQTSLPTSRAVSWPGPSAQRSAMHPAPPGLQRPLPQGYATGLA
eukprot:TRINITY_DN76687_c0_g1_i1.p1 TRINITY_DN76687_c0_g1~~TRINITY_DN76687_c0_g1_i1.p1  ORF type:complete len:356 (-),score=66.34 TRINITY_DN76687_c0_g1_i1:575-1642(-)